jgi:2-amino-4-hydroxy-6-hydroxymethyldihydropteridine diphosphokinase
MRTNCAYIGLGGNEADVRATMDAALDALHDVDIRVTRVSRVYQTAPVGPHPGDPYLNAAAELETDLSPEKLLERLQQLERSFGRQAARRWTSRPIDLDLLLEGDQVIATPTLTLPHPHMWYRRFVLDPLAEIAAETVHPVFGLSVSQLRSDLLRRPLTMTITGGCAEDRLAVGSVLRREDIELVAPDTFESTPLRLQLVDEEGATPPAVREIELATVPGSLTEAAQAVLTAMLDEPQLHSRPLRRIP